MRKVYVFKRVSDFLLITSLENVNFWRGPKIKNSKSSLRKVYVFKRVSDDLMTTSLENVNFGRGAKIKTQARLCEKYMFSKGSQIFS